MQIDPILLATLTSAVTVVARECAKGTGSEAGKAIWHRVAKTLGLNSESVPPDADLAPTVVTALAQRPALAAEIVDLLKHAPASEGGNMVGAIQGDRVVVAKIISVAGDFNM